MKDLDLSIFPTVTKADWNVLAQKQLKGDDPTQFLKWQNDAGIGLEGYFDESDTKTLSYLGEFFNKIPNHTWKLYQLISVKGEAEANKKALEALMGGCDGLIFDLQTSPKWEILLKNIDTKICDIGTIANFDLNIKGYKGPHVNDTYANALKVGEFNDPIQQTVEAISQLKNHSYLLRTSFSDFFLEISTLRALRFLLSKKKDSNIHIHTSIPFHTSIEHQWFLNTTAGLASILGGSHSIDLPTAMGDERISRNTANLIREESGIHEYTDQCGGAYYIEYLTDKIIQAASSSLSKNGAR